MARVRGKSVPPLHIFRKLLIALGIAAQEIAARAQGDKVWLPVRRRATKRPRGLDRYGSTRTALELLLGHEDFVDHVNDSVTGDDVGLHDIG